MWLNSEWVKEQEAHGSNLLVIWFDDVPNKRSIEEIIAKRVKDIDWEANAEDFYF